MERSTTRMLLVPYTLSSGSTTPPFSLGTIEHEPAVSGAAMSVFPSAYRSWGYARHVVLKFCFSQSEYPDVERE